MFYFKVFFIYAQGHFHNQAGYFLFGLFVACKIESMAILRAGMAKVAGYAKVVLEVVDHELLQVFRTDVFRKNFQVLIVFGLRIAWFGKKIEAKHPGQQ